MPLITKINVRTAVADTASSTTATPLTVDAVGDNIADDTAAIQACIDFLQSNQDATGVGGGELIIPAGRYRIVGTLSGDTWNGVALKNGLLIADVNPTSGKPTDQAATPHRNNRLLIRGEGNATELLFDDPDIIGIRCATSFTTIRDLAMRGKVNAGGTEFNKNTIGLALCGEDLQSNTVITHGDMCHFENIHIDSVNHGFYYRNGPFNVSESSAYRNNFIGIKVNKASGACFFIDGAPNPGAAIANRSLFSACVANEANVGFYIKGGDTNTILHPIIANIKMNDPGANGYFNEISKVGSTYNQAVAVGIFIEELGPQGSWGNSKNTFICANMEDNDFDVFNANQNSRFIACNIGGFAIATGKSPNVRMGEGNDYFGGYGFQVGGDITTRDNKYIAQFEGASQAIKPPRNNFPDTNMATGFDNGAFVWDNVLKSMRIWVDGEWRHLMMTGQGNKFFQLPTVADVHTDVDAATAGDGALAWDTTNTAVKIKSTSGWKTGA